MTDDEIARLEELWKAWVAWFAANPFSSRYADERARFSDFCLVHGEQLLAAAREANRLRGEVELLRLKLSEAVGAFEGLLLQWEK
jgi:hypothetical protein